MTAMKSLSRLSRVFAIGALLLLSGCFVTTEQPLSDPNHAQPDPALVGTWRSTLKERDQTPARIRFDERGQGHFEEKAGGGHWKTVRGEERFFVTRTANDTYFNVAVTDPAHPKKNRKKSVYQFLKYRVSDDGKKLTIWTAKSLGFRQAVVAGKLQGYIDKSENATRKAGRRDDSLDDVALRDSPAAILRFIESRPTAELFDEANVLQRID